MELTFIDGDYIAFKRFVSEDAKTKDEFSIYYDLIVHKTCLGNKKGKGYIALKNRYDKNNKEKSLDIKYDSEYTNFKRRFNKPCNYYDFLQIHNVISKDEEQSTIEIPKKFITIKK